MGRITLSDIGRRKRYRTSGDRVIGRQEANPPFFRIIGTSNPPFEKCQKRQPTLYKIGRKRQPTLNPPFYFGDVTLYIVQENVTTYVTTSVL